MTLQPHSTVPKEDRTRVESRLDVQTARLDPATGFERDLRRRSHVGLARTRLQDHR